MPLWIRSMGTFVELEHVDDGFLDSVLVLDLRLSAFRINGLNFLRYKDLDLCF